MGWSEVGDTVCPVALAIVGERWTMLILRELYLGVKRFEEFQAQSGMSSHLLSTRLKRREGDGIVARHPYCDRPTARLPVEQQGPGSLSLAPEPQSLGREMGRLRARERARSGYQPSAVRTRNGPQTGLSLRR